ncbi:MAG: tetratricopeptide repeat protein, partial [Pseudomonadales bacterium]
TGTGIPIALGVIYVAVGRRAGLDIEGVNFPGHFVVRVRLPGGEEMFVDPLAGAVVDEAMLAERVKLLQGDQTELTPEHLASAPARAIVARMLNNLKIVTLQQGDLGRALGYCDWIVELMPHNPVELRDRAVILERLEAFEAAANDYEKLVELVPDEAARRKLKGRIRALRRRRPKTLH